VSTTARTARKRQASVPRAIRVPLVGVSGLPKLRFARFADPWKDRREGFSARISWGDSRDSRRNPPIGALARVDFPKIFFGGDSAAAACLGKGIATRCAGITSV